MTAGDEMGLIYVDTPFGPLEITGDEEAIHAIRFPPLGRRKTESPNRLLREARRQLEAYIVGKRQRFELPLALEGTEFQRAVWNAMARIPYGEVRSYGYIARELGKPGAVRAVGTALGKNPIPVVLPCHRVVASKGLGGFGGGLAIKKFLLDLEGAQGDFSSQG
jgi:methylated-DNA-[protein]-cysteine S-methyltransferase